MEKAHALAHPDRASSMKAVGRHCVNLPLALLSFLKRPQRCAKSLPQPGSGGGRGALLINSSYPTPEKHVYTLTLGSQKWPTSGQRAIPPVSQPPQSYRTPLCQEALLSRTEGARAKEAGSGETTGEAGQSKKAWGIRSAIFSTSLITW